MIIYNLFIFYNIFNQLINYSLFLFELYRKSHFEKNNKEIKRKVSYHLYWDNGNDDKKRKKENRDIIKINLNFFYNPN